MSDKISEIDPGPFKAKKLYVDERLVRMAQLVMEATNDEAFQAAIVRAAEIIQDSIAQGGKLLICGNGGSAADAQHMAAELVGRFRMDRRALPAIALTTDTSALTAIGNDLGFEQIFARQIEALGSGDDVLLVISTSGKSKNIIAAIETARDYGLQVIALTGSNPIYEVFGKTAVCLTIPSAETDLVQQMHLIIEHIICGLVEKGINF